MHSAFTPVLHLFVINYNHERNTQVWHVLSRDHTVLLGTIHIKANNDRLLLAASHTTAVTAVPTPQLLQLFPHHSCYSCSHTTAFTAVPTPQLFPHQSCYSCFHITAVPTPHCSRTKAVPTSKLLQLFPHHSCYSCSHTTPLTHQQWKEDSWVGLYSYYILPSTAYIEHHSKHIKIGSVICDSVSIKKQIINKAAIHLGKYDQSRELHSSSCNISWCEPASLTDGTSQTESV